jgi:YD repeat-containing protein
LGDTYVDDNAFADQVMETESLTGVNGSEVKAAVTTLAVTATTGSMSVSGLPTLYADMVAPSQVREITDLAVGGTETKTTKTTYDAAGRAVLVDVSGTNIAESCTQTSYAGPVPNPNASPITPAVWITRAVAEAITASGPCPMGSGATTTANILRDTRTYYDGSALGAAPTVGNATTVSKAVGATGGSSLTFQTQSTNGYDAMGRIASTADALGHATTISYTPADGGIVTAESTTNALGQSTSSTYDAARGSRLSTADVSGYLTSAAYDALGRLTAVWKPGRSQGNHDAANVTYSYLVSQKVPNALTTNTLVDYGTGTSYLTSVAIDDGRGQTVQTQTAADGGGVTVADAFYDSHGWKVAAWGKYYTTGSPSTTEVSAQQADFNDVSTRIYDTAGRATEAENFNGTALTSSAQTVNGGDRVTVIGHDPAGKVIGTPTTTVADVDGNTIETGQYTAAPAVNGNIVVPAPGTSMQATTTTYDAAGLKTKVTDPGGNAWSYTYDLQGRRTQSVDPDTGTSTTTYDADGNVASNTDANGTADNYVYDVLGRKSAQYTGSTTQGSGTRIATWAYDTLVPGKFYYETSTNPVTGLTYQSGVTGYDAAGNTAGTWVTIPKTGATTGLGGTYTTTYSYTTTGLMTYDDPAVAGGLPSEDIDYTYDQYGNLQTEGLHAYDVYANGASYSPYGQLTQIKLGTGPSAGSLTYNYDPQTGQETLANLSVTAPVPQIDNVTYAYNADRQLVSSTDTEGGSNVGAPVETQCYTYDILDRLSAAWSATDNCAANPFTSKGSA